GISFFTFMAISYVVDVYRGDFAPVGLGTFAAYLSFFPHLVAVAVLCVVAGLAAPVIAGVMVGAWALVALGEWFAARADRERHEYVYGSATPIAASVPDDRSWFDTNGGDTMLDLPSAERPPPRLPPAE
ncbi:MAG TPA: hypothetical protein VFN06_05655, partial [Gaiellaceae bacterium]|nr:hypothetical protein [Gaiellaceae bacterium]